MNFGQILMYVIVFFMILGAFDKITLGKFHLGLKDSFDEGIEAMGPLALSVIGMLCLAPALEGIVIKFIEPVYSFFGADPAMFAGALLSSDTGAYPLAKALTDNYQAACFSGLILGSVLGVVIGFTIPIALGIIEKRDRPYFAQGVLYGIIVVPIGSVAGGMAAGYQMGMILVNSIPTVILSILLAVGIKFFPGMMIKGFEAFGKIIIAIITIGLAASIVEALVGVRLIKNMTPISEGFILVGTLSIVLAGAFPMLHVLTKILRIPLAKVGAALHINEASAAGLVSSLANAIPTLSLMKKMDKRGKVINSAFIVSGSFILGDHMAYTASTDSTLLLPVITAKGISGMLSIIIAALLTKDMKNEDSNKQLVS